MVPVHGGRLRGTSAVHGPHCLHMADTEWDRPDRKLHGASLHADVSTNPPPPPFSPPSDTIPPFPGMVPLLSGSRPAWMHQFLHNAPKLGRFLAVFASSCRPASMTN